MKWGERSGHFVLGDPNREISQTDNIYSFGLTLMLKEESLA